MQHLEMEEKAAAEEVRGCLTTADHECHWWAAPLDALLLCK